MAREYRYYVVVSTNFPREHPYTIVRAWGSEGRAPDEEYFSPRQRWEPGDVLERISRGSMNRDAEEITEREAKQYEKSLKRRFKKEIKESRENTR